MDRPSLSKQLNHHVQVIKSLPRINSEWYPASQGLVDGLGAALGLIVDGLSEFANDHYACQSALMEALTLTLSHPGRPMANDYAHRYQDLCFLWDLGRAYQRSLRRLQEGVGLWSEVDSVSIDALTRFLKAGIEALQVGRKMELYAEQILPSDPRTLGGGKQEVPARLTEPVCRRATEEMKLAGLVCADYQELGQEMADLFDYMAEDIGSVLGALEGPTYVYGCQFFQEYLNDIFGGLLDYSPAVMRQKASSFEYDRWQRPSEVLALTRLRILWRALGLKLRFPDLDRNGGIEGVLLPDNSNPKLEASGHDSGPPLIEETVIRWQLDHTHVSLRPRGSFTDLSSDFEESIDRLGGWVHWLYQRLWSRGERSRLFNVAREWMSQVEGNLGLVLEAIETNGERQRLYVCGVLSKRLVATAFAIERVLGILYGPELLERGRDMPGYVLEKLGQMMESVCAVMAGSGTEKVQSLLTTLQIKREDAAEAATASFSGHHEWSFVYEPDADEQTIRAFKNFCQSGGSRTVAQIGQLVMGTEKGLVSEKQRLITVGTCKSQGECSLAGFAVNRREGRLLLAPAKSEARLWLRFGDRELGDAMEYQWFRRALDEAVQGREWRIRMNGQNRMLVISCGSTDEGFKLIVEEGGEAYEGDCHFFAGAWNEIIRLFGSPSTYDGWYKLALSPRKTKATRDHLEALGNAGSLWALAVSKSVSITVSLEEPLYGALCGEILSADQSNLYHLAFAEGVHRVIPGWIFKSIGRRSLQQILNPALWSTRIIQNTFYPAIDDPGAWELCRMAQQAIYHLGARQRAVVMGQLWGRPAPTAADYFEAWDSRVWVDSGKRVVTISPNRLVVPVANHSSMLSRPFEEAVKPSMLMRLATGLIKSGRETYMVLARIGGVFEALYRLYREEGARRFVQLRLIVQVIDEANQGVTKLTFATNYGFMALGEAGMAGLLFRGIDGLSYTLREASEDGQQERLQFIGFLVAYLAIVHGVNLPVNVGHNLATLTFYGAKSLSKRLLFEGEKAFLRGFAQVVRIKTARSVGFDEWRAFLAFDSAQSLTLMGCRTSYSGFLRLAQLVSVRASGREVRYSKWEEYVAEIERNDRDHFVTGKPSSAEKWLLNDTVAALLDPAAGLLAQDEAGVYHLVESVVRCEASHRKRLRVLGRVLAKMIQWLVPVDYELGDEIGDRMWSFGRRPGGDPTNDTTKGRLDELIAGIFDVLPPGAFGVLRRDEVKELVSSPALLKSSLTSTSMKGDARMPLEMFFEALASFPPHFKFLLWRWATNTLDMRCLSRSELVIKFYIGSTLRVHAGKGEIVVPHLRSVKKYQRELIETLIRKGFGGSWCRLFSLTQMSLAERVEIWRRMRKARNGEKMTLQVRREDVLSSTWRIFEKNPLRFAKKLWTIQFSIGDFLQPGLDLGGPFREWISLVGRQLLEPDNGLFEPSERGECYQIVQRGSLLCISKDLERMYHFAGAIIGEACYSGVALGVRLSPVLCELLAAGCLEGFDYLGALERVDHGSYMMLKSIDLANEEYYFEDGEGCELISGGSNVLVTGENLCKYLELMARRILLGAKLCYVERFLKGFWNRVGAMTLQSHGFTGADVQAILRGRARISVEQWRVQTLPCESGVADRKHALKVIDWFWKIVEGFSQKQLHELLAFCTGMSCMPLRGFRDTQKGHFKLTIIPVGDNQLPTARTCFSELRLPAYDSEAILRVKLEQAMMAVDGGFEIV